MGFVFDHGAFPRCRAVRAATPADADAPAPHRSNKWCGASTATRWYSATPHLFPWFMFDIMIDGADLAKPVEHVL